MSNFGHNSQAYKNVKVRWVAYKRIEPVTGGCFLVVFDLGDKVFGEIELPERLVHHFPKRVIRFRCNKCSILVFFFLLIYRFFS